MFDFLICLAFIITGIAIGGMIDRSIWHKDKNYYSMLLKDSDKTIAKYEKIILNDKLSDEEKIKELMYEIDDISF